MKSLPFFTLLLLASLSYAQKFDYKSYAWESKPTVYKLTEEEKKQSSIVLLARKYSEYELTKERTVNKYQISHTIQILNDDRAVEAFNKIYIPINYYSKLDNIFSRVVINGKVVSEQGIKDVKKLEEKEVQYYLLALEGVGKGAMIETIISLQVSPNLYASEFLQTQNLTRESYFTLVTPENLIFKSKIYNSNTSVTDTVIEGKRYINYAVKNVPALEEEKYALEDANRIRVEYNFDANTENPAARSDKWSDMGRMYFDRLYTNYEKNAKEIDKLLKKLPLAGKSNEEKAFLIENYIKSNINFVQNAQDEELISTVLKNKYASLFGIIQLTALSLDRAKIPHEIIITCEKDDKQFDPDFDSWSFLNDVIISLTESKSFITPGNALLRTGYPPAGFLGQKGLFIKAMEVGKEKKGITAIKTIPYNDMEKSFDKHIIKVKVDDDLANSTIDYQREMSDYACLGIKTMYYYAEENQKKEFLESLLTNGNKEIKVSDTKIDNYNITSLMEYKAPLKLSATLTTDAYLEKAGDKVLLKIGELIGPQEQIYQEKKRQNPIDMPYAHYYDREIRVKVPVGYKFDGLDKLNIDHSYSDNEGPMFGFKSSYKLEGDELIVNCREFYRKISLPVEKFEDFRKVINDAADFNKITILVKK